MKINSTIHNFCATGDRGFKTQSLKVGSEVKFISGSLKKRIAFKNNNKEHFFDLKFYSVDNERQFQLRENRYLNKEFLKKLSFEFSFDLISDPIHPDYTRGVLKGINTGYSLPLMGSIKKIMENFFL